MSHTGTRETSSNELSCLQTPSHFTRVLDLQSHQHVDVISLPLSHWHKIHPPRKPWHRYALTVFTNREMCTARAGENQDRFERRRREESVLSVHRLDVSNRLVLHSRIAPSVKVPTRNVSCCRRHRFQGGRGGVGFCGVRNPLIKLETSLEH